MFKSTKSCLSVLIIGIIVYFVALFFLLQAAKDDGLMWVAAIVVGCVIASVCGKAARKLFASGPLLKLVAAIALGIFAVGTLAMVVFVFAGI